MEEQLIAEIERRPVLYDRSVQACKKMSARDEAWREVADIMKQSGTARSLRVVVTDDDTYTRPPGDSATRPTTRVANNYFILFSRGRGEETMENVAGLVHEVPPVAADVRPEGQEENVDLLQRDGVFGTAHRAQRVMTIHLMRTTVYLI